MPRFLALVADSSKVAQLISSAARPSFTLEAFRKTVVAGQTMFLVIFILQKGNVQMSLGTSGIYVHSDNSACFNPYIITQLGFSIFQVLCNPRWVV